jgi:hypothetical protein
MYSPEIFGDAQNSWFGGKPAWWPGGSLVGGRSSSSGRRAASAHLLLLPRRLLQGVLGDPPGCTVGEPRKTYRGEASFPLVIQNIHRYFLYLALIFLVFLAHDVWKALWFTDPATGETSFGIGVGTLVLALNTVLLAGYTFGCHSLRHLVGGSVDELSKSPARFAAYRCVGCFNRRHMLWAWTSLFAVAFADRLRAAVRDGDLARLEMI